MGVQSEPSDDVVAVGQALLGWFTHCGRAFHWRRAIDPYEVLIAEILLRKTVAPVVNRFLVEFFRRYPSPVHLAQAQPADLAAVLAPLGLSDQRALQLHHLGRHLQAEHDGVVPTSIDALLQLPGVGPYTAAMLAATCGREAIPAVDTNVARVLCRVFGIVPSHFEARKSPNVWQTAGTLLRASPGSPADFNWALLDLGALICTARRPKCPSCPLRRHCAFARGAIAAVPHGDG